MRAVLGVTGCIAAYKSALVLRLLQKEGFEVIPVMTSAAERFITPLTLEKLAGRPVVTDMFGADADSGIQHISLARESDILIVSPATANIIGKFAHGIADDFLSTLYVSTTTPVVVAPGMNVEMWRHPALQENVSTLRRHGVTVAEPAAGYLACGEVGEGRMAEPEEIVSAALSRLDTNSSLDGVRVLVTAGPTVEDIDPVRFLSNRSSGKMGYAIAREAVRRGAEVTLISGPTSLPSPQGLSFLPVRSASEMESAVLDHFPDSRIVVMSAAVSDFTPVVTEPRKIKKRAAEPLLRLESTTDILKTLGEEKSDSQFLVGFAAESDRLRDFASEKLERKNLDLIVANDITLADSTFQSDFNQALLMDRWGWSEELPRMSKAEMAARIWDEVVRRLSAGRKEIGAPQAVS